MDRIVIEHTSLQSNEDCFSSFLLSSLEDNEVKKSLRKDEWQELSEYFIKTRNLGIIKKFIDRIGYPRKEEILDIIQKVENCNDEKLCKLVNNKK